jgi:hypothetical protein
MKFFVFLLVLIGIGIIIFVPSYEWDPTKRMLAQKTSDFIESLKFKDFKRAAQFHSLLDKNRKNIPKLIEQKFLIKPEFLNIVNYEIQFVELNKKRDRARVKTLITIEILNSGNLNDKSENKVKTVDMMFYWAKEPVYEKTPSGKIKKVEGKYEWYHKLQSSL